MLLPPLLWGLRTSCTCPTHACRRALPRGFRPIRRFTRRACCANLQRRNRADHKPTDVECYHQLTGIERIAAHRREGDFTLFVLDYFFVATPAVARSFGAIARTNPLWWRGTHTMATAASYNCRLIRRRLHGCRFCQDLPRST